MRLILIILLIFLLLGGGYGLHGGIVSWQWRALLRGGLGLVLVVILVLLIL